MIEGNCYFLKLDLDTCCQHYCILTTAISGEFQWFPTRCQPFVAIYCGMPFAHLFKMCKGDTRWWERDTRLRYWDTRCQKERRFRRMRSNMTNGGNMKEWRQYDQKGTNLCVLTWESPVRSYNRRHRKSESWVCLYLLHWPWTLCPFKAI